MGMEQMKKKVTQSIVYYDILAATVASLSTFGLDRSISLDLYRLLATHTVQTESEE
jgi:hypothetical protein